MREFTLSKIPTEMKIVVRLTEKAHERRKPTMDTSITPKTTPNMTLSSKKSRLWIEYVVVKPINTMEQMNTAVRKFTKSLFVPKPES